MEPAVFRGWNGSAAVLLGLAALWVGALLPPATWPLVALPVALSLLGERYALEVSTAGIDLRIRSLWVLRRRHLRFFLDAQVIDPDSWWEPGWGGVGFVARSGFESPLFGPCTDAPAFELARRIRRAVEAFRRECAPVEGFPRFEEPPGLERAIDRGSITRWPSGRVRECTLASDLRLGRVTLPAGTRLRVNGQGWLDPRSPDVLRSAILSASTALPIRGLPPAQAGAEIRIERGRPTGASNCWAESPRFHAFEIDGRGSIGWSTRGRLGSFALGAPLAVGRFTAPAGTRATSTGSFGDWHLWTWGPEKIRGEAGILSITVTRRGRRVVRVVRERR